MGLLVLPVPSRGPALGFRLHLVSVFIAVLILKLDHFFPWSPELLFSSAQPFGPFISIFYFQSELANMFLFRLYVLNG